LTATASATQVDLRWTDNSDSEVGFRIERSANGLPFAEIGRVGRDTTAYSDTAAPVGSQYVYRVSAYNDGGSSYSNTASVDRIQPTVSFTSPAADALVSGVVSLQAIAADAGGVARVSFYVGTTLIGIDGAAPYTVDWNSRSVTDGSYTLRATASDTAANNTNVTRAVTVANAGPPQLWTSTDVGNVGLPGQATFATGTFVVSAAGTDVWAGADSFHFLHLPLTGDGDIVARVDRMEKPADAVFAMAGIMFRESLDPRSRHAALIISTQGKAKFRRRLTTGGTTYSDGPSTGTAFPPRWLKLSRRGATFSAYLSTDGIAWTPAHTPQAITLPSTLHVGFLALRSGGSGLARATFSSVVAVNGQE
jgi:hypothetical protein